MSDRLAEVTHDVATLARPPRRVSVADCATESMTIKLSSGAAGSWDADRTPYVIEPMDMLKSRGHESVVFVGPARSGKTLGLIDGWVVHSVIADPGDIGLYFSTQPLAHDWRKRRLSYQHRHSPAIKAMLSPRAHDTNIEWVQYRHGMIANLGWPSSSQLAQRDLRYVALSDYDSFPDDVDGEGSAFDLAKKRTQVAGSAGMCLVESSPKRVITAAQWTPDGAHQAPPVDGGILPLYNRGDRRRWHWQCIDGCGDWFEAPALPSYDDHHDIAEAAQTAHVACPHCGTVYRPEDKDRLNASAGKKWVPEGCHRDKDGNIIGTPRASSIVSYWLLGCAAAFQSWVSLVQNEITARRDFESSGDDRALKTTRNVDQGIPHRPASLARVRTAEFLDARREYWERFTVPLGVRFLIAFVDIQQDRFEVRVWGYGKDRERWLIDAYSIKKWNEALIRPASYLEHWAAVTERVVLGTYQLGADKELRILRVGVDSGGYAEDQETQTTARAYDWWRQLRKVGLGHRVHLLKGSPRDGKLVREIYPDAASKGKQGTSRGDIPVLELNSNALKDMAYSDMLRESPGQGYIHIPDWLDAKYLDELVSEVREPKGWVKIAKRRNETWDALYSADGVCNYLKVARINWDKPPPWALDNWDLNSEVVTREQRLELKKKKRRRRSTPAEGIAPSGWGF